MKKAVLIILVLLPGLGLSAQKSVNRILLPISKDSTAAVVGYSLRDEERARGMSEGDGLVETFFDASSLVHLSEKDAVEGRITYRNGKKRNVRWNTASDFGLLYPYVLADSLGGDLSGESYSFHGGYSRRVGDLFLGGRASYRALHEYRDFDPRPRAITSDFSVDLSTGFLAGGNHLVDLTAGYRRYHQSLSVIFADMRGANTAEFHMTGLGSHFSRFQSIGGYANTRYRGHGLTAAADFIPLNSSGLDAGVSYGFFSSVRHLVNQNEAPITELATHTFEGRVFWLSSQHWGKWAAGADASAELRRGDENIVSNLVTGNFETLLKMRMYYRDEYSADIWAELFYKAFHTRPSVGFTTFDASHLYPARKISLRTVSAELPVEFSLPSKTLSVKISGSSGVDISSDGTFMIPSEYTMERLLNDMKSQFEVVSDTRIRLSGGFSLGKDIGKGFSLILGGRISRWIYAGGYGATLAEFSCGISL